MATKSDRLEIIAKIIREQKIENQDALLLKLKELGIETTQATLSRDLKTLRVGRISDGWSAYYYAMPEDTDKETLREEDYIKAVHFGVRSIEFSGAFGVIKTRVGHANSVAAALDHIDLPEILGSIAGDDTIFIVLREGSTKEDLIASFKERIPDIK